MTADDLRIMLAETGTSQMTLSRRLGVHGPTVRRWLSGVHPISPPTAVAIRCVLGLCSRCEHEEQRQDRRRVDPDAWVPGPEVSGAE